MVSELFTPAKAGCSQISTLQNGLVLDLGTPNTPELKIVAFLPNQRPPSFASQPTSFGGTRLKGQKAATKKVQETKKQIPPRIFLVVSGRFRRWFKGNQICCFPPPSYDEKGSISIKLQIRPQGLGKLSLCRVGSAYACQASPRFSKSFLRSRCPGRPLQSHSLGA